MESTYKDLLVALSDITPEEAYNELQENPNHELKEQYEFIIKKDPDYAYLYFARFYARDVIEDKNFWDNN
jgi:hypothetical protein